ncbi:hypothetical protein LSAT2_023942 [Lamellibrachia satsuma]|nr:hypothetical protein LSAT2_023942 [Lamellibrachia satsuma]
MLQGPPPIITYKPGQTVRLRCLAKGYPTYEWYVNDVHIRPSAQYSVVETPRGASVLAIQTMHNDQPCSVQCWCKNRAGTSFSNATLLRPAVLRHADSVGQTGEIAQSVYEGRPLILPCAHATSVPRAVVTWYTVTCHRCVNPKRRHIRTSRRIAIDDNGGLVFANVQLSDAQKDRMYKCDIYNTVLRESIGGSYRLSLNTTTGNKKLKFYLHELRFADIRYEDEGYYQCRAYNRLGRSRPAVIFLSVQSLPTVIHRPINVNITPEGTAVFLCSGRANPAAKTVWYINGRRLRDVFVSSTTNGSVAVAEHGATIFVRHNLPTTTSTPHSMTEPATTNGTLGQPVAPVWTTDIPPDKEAAIKFIRDYSLPGLGKQEGLS